MKNAIIDISEEDIAAMEKNSRRGIENLTLEDFLTFLDQYNEMIGHRRREHKPITGIFLL